MRHEETLYLQDGKVDFKIPTAITTNMSLFGLKIQPPRQSRRTESHASASKPKDPTKDPTNSRGEQNKKTPTKYRLIFGCIRVPRLSRGYNQQSQQLKRQPTQRSTSSRQSDSSTIFGFFDNARPERPGRPGRHARFHKSWLSEVEMPLMTSGAAIEDGEDDEGDEAVYYPAEECGELVELD
jgi:hypothetical protein